MPEQFWSSAPEGPVIVPPAVAALASDLRCVWVNGLGGLTFEVVGAGRFIKWAPHNSGVDLADEAARLEWASLFARVPRLLDQGSDEQGQWMMTAALDGENAVTERWRADPARAVIAIGEGLRALHEALPVASCPFSWSAEERLGAARSRAGKLKPTRWHPTHRRLSVVEALNLAAEVPPIDSLVVCHGDACAPNTLLSEDGRWSGHVDMGCLGVADRWADIAIATWSTTWNYGEGWENEVLAAYGVDPDPERTRYYRLLWDLDPT